MAPSEPIIFFHYPFSPYSQKITAYLALRQIPYTECIQPVTQPRPDMDALGVKYRRIPIMSIGRDIYCDTLLIFEKLEQLYPYSEHSKGARMSSDKPHERAMERLLEKWTSNVVFKFAAAAIPTTIPIMSDKQFTEDRKQLWGRDWEAHHQDSLRPEALAVLRQKMELLENDLLDDKRDWIHDSKTPTLADIHGAWIFNWLCEMGPDAMPEELFGKDKFPKSRAYFQRYAKALEEAREAWKPNVKSIEGEEAVKQINAGGFGEPEGEVDPVDPTGFKKGETVEAYPTDTGFSHRDIGKLVALNTQETVIGGKTKEGNEIRIHHPRWLFAVEKPRN